MSEANMDEVKRYAGFRYVLNMETMLIDRLLDQKDDGHFVLHSDYQSLQSQLAKVTQERDEAREEKVCEWRWVQYEDLAYFTTKCGEEDDKYDPTEEGVPWFCPFCGGKIKEANDE